MKRSMLYFLALCFLLLPVLSGTALAKQEKGSVCGKGLTWELDTDSGVLTITGNGPMTDYVTSDDNRVYYVPPWWYRRDEVRSVVFEEGVTTVGKAAFYGCEKLTAVQLPDTLETIGISAFTGCINLPEIAFPDGLTAIYAGAFSGCKSLTHVEFPEGIQRINGFSNCESLTAVTIPDGVEPGGDCFSGCKNLVSAELGQGIETVSGGLFRDCVNLREVRMPDSVETIEAFAFSGCGSLKDIYYGGTEAQWKRIDVSYYSRLVGTSGDVNDAMRSSWVRLHCEMYSPAPWIQYSRNAEIGFPGSLRAETSVYVEGPALAYSAAYDGNGQCLEIRSHPLTAGEVSDLSFACPEGTRSVKLFVVDGTVSPLCPGAGNALEIQDPDPTAPQSGGQGGWIDANGDILLPEAP